MKLATLLALLLMVTYGYNGCGKAPTAVEGESSSKDPVETVSGVDFSEQNREQGATTFAVDRVDQVTILNDIEFNGAESNQFDLQGEGNVRIQLFNGDIILIPFSVIDFKLSLDNEKSAECLNLLNQALANNDSISFTFAYSALRSKIKPVRDEILENGTGSALERFADTISLKSLEIGSVVRCAIY